MGASESSAAEKYGAHGNWFQDVALQKEIVEFTIQPSNAKNPVKKVYTSPNAFVAAEVEEQFAKRGRIVISNAKSHRMRSDISLLLPEVNPDHLEWTHCDQSQLFDHWTDNGMKAAERKIWNTACQWDNHAGFSGAGYPGLSSLDILDNVIPIIGGMKKKLRVNQEKYWER